MRKQSERGFTVVELLTSCTLAAVVMILLFNILIAIKEDYLEDKIETDYHSQQALLSYALNEDAINCSVSSIVKTGSNFTFTFLKSDTCPGGTKILKLEENKVTYNGIEYEFPSGVTVSVNDSKATEISVSGIQYYSLKIPITINLYSTGEEKNLDITTFYIKMYIAPTIPSGSYTVIYTDGISGEVVFPDQGYEELKEGDATPAYIGTPSRSGYTFMGWAPAINPVVNGDDADNNGNIIYTATWQKVGGTPTSGDYTVIYTDGVSGEVVFPDQVYEELNAGSATPSFVGNTTRNGYTFMGWAPAVNPVVNGDDADNNGNITYIATWQKIS